MGGIRTVMKPPPPIPELHVIREVEPDEVFQVVR